ncbi:MAG: molecular chaperone TorD family protein [Deltaproteobacteria bacterium]|nr:molecular chaperone TorD family protein [Deltaproteobacteria bacterium]
MPPNDPAGSNLVEAEIQMSLDRACVYRALAGLFKTPDEATLTEARDRNLPEQAMAVKRLSGDEDLLSAARQLCDLFDDVGSERLRRSHHAAFDESSDIRCAPTEMDQLGGVPQLELTRTFEMADVAGFYKAFGVEVGEGDERVDHIAAELEFMNLLAVKQAVALQDEGPGEHAQICRDASRVFLRDHLLRWAPRLGQALAESGGDPIHGAAGRLLSQFINFDAALLDAEGAPVYVVDPTRPEKPTQLPAS